ncbi:very short patch repair endonuclease [Leptospira interrogans]
MVRRSAIPSELRSRTMRAVKSKHTAPEIIVRRLVHSLGYRFRIHREDLPGKPDIVFPSRNKVIFVNGCFWHGHTCTRGAREPKTNADYWRTKIARNRLRDASSKKALRSLGWRSSVVWECELKSPFNLRQKIRRFLA